MATRGTDKLICDTLLDMMEDEPWHQIKITDLARAAKISRSTFYVYFDSIFDVLQQIEDEFYEGLAAETEVGEGYWDCDYVSVESLRYIQKNLRLIRIMNGPNGDATFWARGYNRARRVTGLLMEKNASTATPLELEAFQRYYYYGKNAFLNYWAEHEDEYSIAEIAEVSTKFYRALHGVLY